MALVKHLLFGFKQKQAGSSLGLYLYDYTQAIGRKTKKKYEIMEPQIINNSIFMTKIAWINFNQEIVHISQKV